MDKAYHGSQNVIKGTIFPFKGKNFTLDHKEFNKNISHNRIIVEHWFGKLKKLWRMM